MTKKDLICLANKNKTFETVRVNQEELELFFNEDYCFQSVETVKTLRIMILDVFRTFFGVNGANVDDMLIDGITAKLKAKYNSITFTQLRYCFINQTIEKREYVSLSVDEFVKYLDLWTKKEKVIKLALAEVEQMEAEKKQAEQEKIKFENSCRKIYQESIEAGQWLGDRFEAQWILANIPTDNNVDSARKAELWDLALIEAKEKVEAENRSMMKYAPTDYVTRVKAVRKQVYSDLLINEMFK